MKLESKHSDETTLKLQVNQKDESKASSNQSLCETSSANEYSDKNYQKKENVAIEEIIENLMSLSGFMADLNSFEDAF